MISWGDNINALEYMGNTPLVRLANFERSNHIRAHIYAKLEWYNPFGSIKDRAALSVIKKAEINNKLCAKSCIIEATSGNMGIALAGISKLKGYDCKIIMPENMSEVRKKLIIQYGAELILTSAELGIQGSMNEAHNLLLQSKYIYYADQFNNYDCVKAHKLFTAPEIQKQINGEVDVIIAGIGTGATIRGLGEYFKSVNPSTEIIGILPSSFPHSIQGIGAGFNPPFLRKETINNIIYVENEEALEEKENIYKSEILFVGLSSGAVIAGLKKLLKTKKYEDKNIVLIFPDGGERYEK